MVYELYFKNDVIRQKCEVLKHIMLIPLLNNINYNYDVSDTDKIYEQLVSPDSQVNRSMLQFNLIESIKNFESNKV